MIARNSVPSKLGTEVPFSSGKEINRIVIWEENVFGNLGRCKVCNINFSVVQPCIMCQLKREKEEELRRELTGEEIWELGRFLR